MSTHAFSGEHESCLRNRRRIPHSTHESVRGSKRIFAERNHRQCVKVVSVPLPDAGMGDDSTPVGRLTRRRERFCFENTRLAAGVESCQNVLRVAIKVMILVVSPSRVILPLSHGRYSGPEAPVAVVFHLYPHSVMRICHSLA